MLTIEDVSKTYPDGTRALDGVSLKVHAGVFGLLGPNGAGKSSLMRTIATLQRPTTGTITMDGIDVVAAPERARALLGYLPQDFGLYPQATAQDQLDHFAVLKGIVDRRARRDLVEKLLVEVNLWAVRKQRLRGFSGGMRQRLGIAQALIGDPRILVVDEPTAGLDPAERHRILELLATAGERSIVLLSTHIVAEVEALCARMAIISGGRLQRVASPGEAIAELQGRVWHVPGDHPPGFDPGVAIIARKRLRGQSISVAVADSSPTASSEAAQPTLEDAYFFALNRTVMAEQA